MATAKARWCARAPLIDIDSRPYQATLKQARGTLQHDEGWLAQARMDLQRYQDAYARNAIAKQQLDDQAQTVAEYEGSVKADQGTVAYDEVQLEYCHIVAPIAGRVGLRLVDPGWLTATAGVPPMPAGLSAARGRQPTGDSGTAI
jgi:membrane fusion protein, multidrug efflux system